MYNGATGLHRTACVHFHAPHTVVLPTFGKRLIDSRCSSNVDAHIQLQWPLWSATEQASSSLPAPSHVGTLPCSRSPSWNRSSWLVKQTTLQRWSRALTFPAVTKLLLWASVVPALALAVQPWLTTVLPGLDTWQGPLRDMFSFTVLLSVFIKPEPAAAAASAVSAAGGAALVVAAAAYLPRPAACVATCLAGIAAAILRSAAVQQRTAVRAQHAQPVPAHNAASDGARALEHSVNAGQHNTAFFGSSSNSSGSSSNSSGSSSSSSGSSSIRNSNSINDGGAGSSRRTTSGSSRHHQDPEEHAAESSDSFQELLGVLGGGLLLQFCWSECSGGSAALGVEWLVPVVAGAVGVLLLNTLLRHLCGSTTVPAVTKARLRDFMLDWPAWSATLLLILQSLQQLVSMALQPAALIIDASSEMQLLLLVLANGLMVPRALLTRQFMWFTGTCSGALLAASQLLLLKAAQLLHALQACPTGTGWVAAAQQSGCHVSGSTTGVCHAAAGQHAAHMAVLLPTLQVGGDRGLCAVAVVCLLSACWVLSQGWSFIVGEQHSQVAL